MVSTATFQAFGFGSRSRRFEINKKNSPGLLDNNLEQIRNKLKISAYVLETT